MKRKILTVLALCASSVIVAGCETLAGVLPTENACEVVYTDVEADSTETLRAILFNNKSISAQEKTGPDFPSP